MTTIITTPENVIAVRETTDAPMPKTKKPIKVEMVYLPSENYPEHYEGREGAGGDFDALLKRAATPLGDYKKELKSQGVSDELTQDIIDGLADSPLHDGKNSK